jgi:hypothetical protein
MTSCAGQADWTRGRPCRVRARLHQRGARACFFGEGGAGGAWAGLVPGTGVGPNRFWFRPATVGVLYSPAASAKRSTCEGSEDAGKQMTSSAPACSNADK